MKPFCAIATFLLLFVSVAAAQAPADFPSRPVKLFVPFAAGGPTDVVARILADLLSARWNGQSVVIENRPGAGTIVATAAVAKAPPDGTTMLVATNSLLINPAIGQKLPYETEKDFAAVSMVATQPVALVANKSFPATPFRNWWRAKKSPSAQFHCRGRAVSGTLPARCSAARRHRHDPYHYKAARGADRPYADASPDVRHRHSAKRHVDPATSPIAGADAQRLGDAPEVATIAET